MKISVQLVMTVFLALMLNGCTYQMTNYTMVSTRNIDFSQPLKVDINKRVQGEDIASIIVIVPLGMSTESQAMDNAIQQTPNCIGLTNVSISIYMWYIPLIYGKTGYVVEGNPVCINTSETK